MCERQTAAPAHSLDLGRLAPSPTGALHLGNARTFLLAWLSARGRDGKILLRIEDIDSPRVKPWAMEATIRDLEWLGIDWDAGPDLGDGASGTFRPEIPLIQTQRLLRYRQVLEELIDAGQVYRCICSRSDVVAAASAPHDDALPQLEGHVYPGTCRQSPVDSSAQTFAWRWRFDDSLDRWHDRFCGTQTAQPAQQLGDFVVARSDGTPAYQLAVVVDDYDAGVTEVIRGDDLIFSTYRQRAILGHFDWPIPSYFHVPLIVGTDGRRLAKRHGDTRLSALRELGIRSTAIIGYLAHTLGLRERIEPCEPTELIGRLDWKKIPRQATVFDYRSGVQQLKSIS